MGTIIKTRKGPKKKCKKCSTKQTSNSNNIGLNREYKAKDYSKTLLRKYYKKCLSEG